MIPTQQTAQKSHLSNPSYDKMNDRGKLGFQSGAHIAIIMPSQRPERPTRIEILRQAVIDDEPLDEGAMVPDRAPWSLTGRHGPQSRLGEGFQGWHTMFDSLH
ncbi:hypothetical protein SUGI_0666420 [Cryptomeria japonica]|nr:hypothetical protein SUGI_0666420 [Cryptomeria japonica]